MIRFNYKNFYKALAVILSVILCILSLTACGQSVSTSNSSDLAQAEDTSVDKESTDAAENSADSEKEKSENSSEKSKNSDSDSASAEDTNTTIEDDEESAEGAPAVPTGAFIDDKKVPYEDIAGSYNGIGSYEASISIYSSPEAENIIGNIEITDESGNVIIYGELAPLVTNYYDISGSDYTMTVYTDNGNVCLETFKNGEHDNYFVMTEPYIS